MKLLAIDGNSILNRAFYGIRLLSNKKGVFTNAIFGFMNIYLKNFGDVQPDSVAVAFDLRSPTFRHKAVDYYKANRKGMPEELAQQLPLVKELLEHLGITVLTCEGYEADDILGTLSRLCTESGNQCFVLTGDRDSLQLIDENVTVLLATNKETIHYTPQRFAEDYGFEPIRLIDLKALMGDSSDNIPGVPGIGEKTASALIKEYGTVEELYEKYADSGLTKGVKAKLEKGADSAKESKWLATIVRDVPINSDLSAYALREPDKAAVSQLLTELEMFKLLDKLNIPASAAEKLPEKKTAEFTPVELTASELTEEIIAQLKNTAYIYDGSRLSVMEGTHVYVTDDPRLEELFAASECKKITIDSKPFHRFAADRGERVADLDCDAAICGYLLDPLASEYTVEKLCAVYGVHYRSENGEFADLASLPDLTAVLLEEIEKEGMTELLRNIELPLTEVLGAMESVGVQISRSKLSEFGDYLKERIEELKNSVYSEADHEFNIASPKQLGTVLFEEMGLPAKKKTKSGYSTNSEVLEELRNFAPIVDYVLEYRQHTKLLSTYVLPLQEKADEKNRVHSVFRQTETRTGRISSTEPNLQNIPVRTELGAELRKCIVAAASRVLVDADYSQIELRVMAHLSGDENMIAAFTSGEDIHTSTAAKIFDMPPEMVTPEMRTAAKAVNFGIIYGIGPFSLAKDLGISVAQAKKYISDYFAKYPKVKEFLDKTVEEAMKTGCVRTMFGRKRYIPELLSSNKNVQAAGKRIAMNTPVQGTAADLIKIAMVNVYRRLCEEKISADLILQVHDELIIEADPSVSELCEQLLREEMTNACKLSVPLTVDVHRGETWYEAKGL